MRPVCDVSCEYVIIVSYPVSRSIFKDNQTTGHTLDQQFPSMQRIILIKEVKDHNFLLTHCRIMSNKLVIRPSLIVIEMLVFVSTNSFSAALRAARTKC
jgi:hypothetical protein